MEVSAVGLNGWEVIGVNDKAPDAEEESLAPDALDPVNHIPSSVNLENIDAAMAAPLQDRQHILAGSRHRVTTAVVIHIGRKLIKDVLGTGNRFTVGGSTFGGGGNQGQPACRTVAVVVVNRERLALGFRPVNQASREQVDSGAGAAKRVIEPVKGLRTLTA